MVERSYSPVRVVCSTGEDRLLAVFDMTPLQGDDAVRAALEVAKTKFELEEGQEWVYYEPETDELGGVWLMITPSDWGEYGDPLEAAFEYENTLRLFASCVKLGEFWDIDLL